MNAMQLENLAWNNAKKDTFIFGEDSLDGISINDGGNEWYYFKTNSGKLIKRFCLEKSTRVATFCTVTLVKNGSHFEPRLSFEKRDFLINESVNDEYPCEELTHNVKAKVDTKGGQDNFWKLISALQNIAVVEVPRGGKYEVVQDSDVALLAAASKMDRASLIELVHTATVGGLTAEEINLLADRRRAIEEFDNLLNDDEYFRKCQEEYKKETGKSLKAETLWQNFFQRNPWIFGYGLTPIWHESFDADRLESTVSGYTVWNQQGRRTDALMRTRTAFSSLLFCEIKTHKSDLLGGSPYRGHLYTPSKELAGAVAQVQDTSQSAIETLRSTINEIKDKDGYLSGEYFTTIRPRHAVVIGDTKQLLNDQGQLNESQIKSFENYRRSILDVDVLTFDELRDRASFIVHSSEQ